MYEREDKFDHDPLATGWQGDDAVSKEIRAHNPPPPRNVVLADGTVFDIEREFYCLNCKDFRDVFAGPPGDIVCWECHYIVATFKDRMVIRPEPRLQTQDAGALAPQGEETA